MNNSSVSKSIVLTFVFFILIASPLVFFQTFLSMVHTWIVDETFTHGFLIFPISLILIWKKRKVLAELAPQPEFLFFPLLPIFLFAWFLGQIADVLVVQQFALIFIIISLVLILLGRKVFLLLLFPLLFLILSVPFGNELIPIMMEFTANFTVYLLNITGIPVLHEGLHFSLPSGNWSVVEACSGVRYLIASFTLGIIYSYINFNSIRKRLIFILVSIIVPIFANGFRAYGIVMIGHLSGMELATGVDHLIYGWVFFGVIIFILFYIGSRWWDDEPSLQQEISSLEINPEKNVFNLQLFSYFCAASLIVIVLTIQFNEFLKYKIGTASENISLILPAKINNWNKNEYLQLGWNPIIKNPDILSVGHYQADSNLIQLTIGYYQQQRQGAEAVTQLNRVAKRQGGEWTKTDASTVDIGDLNIQETIIRKGVNVLRVWNWYLIGNQETSNAYIAKALTAFNIIAYQRTDAAFITIATPITDNETDQSRQLLREFHNKARLKIKKLIAKNFE